MLIMLLIGVLFQQKSIVDFGLSEVIMGTLLAALFALVIDYPKKFLLDLNQEKEVRDHLHQLGYQPTTDPDGKSFFRRRKFITWHTARLERNDEYLILRSSENHGKYFRQG